MGYVLNMSTFTTPLIVRETGTEKWIVEEPFIYWIGAPGNENDGVIAIPKGFVTDFASVPRRFWHVLPPFGKYGKAAVVHDALYASEFFERSRCDEIFLEAMKVLGVSWLVRYTMYAAVRAAGWAVWLGHDKKEVSRVKKTIEDEIIKNLTPVI